MIALLRFLAFKSLRGRDGIIEKYVVLLRGINVGKNHRLAMGDLKLLLAKLGYQQIKTYIQSGNVVMSGPKAATEVLASEIEATLYHFAGFPIPVVLYTATEYAAMIQNNPITKGAFVVEDPIVIAYQQTEVAEVDLYTKVLGVEAGVPFKKAVFIQIEGTQTDSAILKDYQKLFKKGNWTVRNWKTSLKLLQLLEDLIL